MKEQTKRNHLNHSPAPSAHSTRSYLSSYLAHAHSPSPSIKSQKPLPPVKSRGVGVNEKPPSRHDHLQIISDFHQALTTFQSLQINTVEWSLGMKDRIRESQDIFTQCLSTYVQVVQENDSLKKEKMEYQDILNRLVSKSDRIHQLVLTLQPLKESLQHRCVRLEAALCGSHRQIRVLDGVRSKIPNPPLSSPIKIPKSYDPHNGSPESLYSTPTSLVRRLEDPCLISAEALRAVSPAETVENDSSYPQSNIVTAFPLPQDLNYPPFSSPIAVLQSSSLLAAAQYHSPLLPSSATTLSGFEDCEDQSEGFTSPQSREPQSFPCLTIVTDEFFEIDSSSVSSPSICEETKVGEDEESWKQRISRNADAHLQRPHPPLIKTRPLSDFFSQASSDSYKKTSSRSESSEDPVSCSLPSVLARESRQCCSQLLSPKDFHRLTEQVSALANIRAIKHVTVSALNPSHHCDPTPPGGGMYEEQREKEWRGLEELDRWRSLGRTSSAAPLCPELLLDTNSAASSPPSDNSVVEIDWEFDFQVTCSRFQSEPFSFHGSVWRISLERVDGVLHRLRYLLSLRRLRENKTALFRLENCQFTISSTCPSTGLSPAPLTLCPSSKGRQGGHSHRVTVGSELLKFVQDGKLKISTRVEVRLT